MAGKEEGGNSSHTLSITGAVLRGYADGFGMIILDVFVDHER